MTEEFQALLAIAIGFLSGSFGLFITVFIERQRRKEHARLMQREADLPLGLMKAFIDSAVRDMDGVDAKLAVDSWGDGVSALIQAKRLKVDKAGILRAVPQARTVEVERHDGSRVELGVDPDNADSISDFLDRARDNHAERVLAVH